METQLFRIAGKATKTIHCDDVNGHSVIYWEDIEQVFPGVIHVMSGEDVVKLMRGSDRKRYVH